MIGSLELATQIGKHNTNRRAPKNWRFVGQGGSRTAYLGPDGMVYKVDHSDYYNVTEAQWGNKLRKRKILEQFDTVIPPITSYKVPDYFGEKSVVNAMPYLPSQVQCYCQAYDGYDLWTGLKCNCRKFGTPRPCFALVWEMLEGLGMEDVWEANLSYNNRKIWVIDLGEYSGV